MTTSNFFNDYMNNDNTNIDMLTNTVETEYYEIELDKFIQLEGIAAMMEVTVDYLLEEFCVNGELDMSDVPWEDNNNWFFCNGIVRDDLTPVAGRIARNSGFHCSACKVSQRDETEMGKDTTRRGKNRLLQTVSVS